MEAFSYAHVFLKLFIFSHSLYAVVNMLIHVICLVLKNIRDVLWIIQMFYQKQSVIAINTRMNELYESQLFFGIIILKLEYNARVWFVTSNWSLQITLDWYSNKNLNITNEELRCKNDDKYFLHAIFWFIVVWIVFD